MYNFDFMVTICMGGGDGGDVVVEMEVTDEELALLKRCVREDEEMDCCGELDDFCERLSREAIDESVFCGPDDEDEEEYESASCIFTIPDEIYEMVENEDRPEGDEAILDRACALMEDDPEELLPTFLEENEGRYGGNLGEEVFREAVRRGNLAYIEENIDEIDLNDEGGSSSYLDETEDASVQELLMRHGAFRDWDYYTDFPFAMETINGSVLAMDDGLMTELREKYLEALDTDEEGLAEMLEDPDCIPEDVSRDIESELPALGWEVCDGELCETDVTGSECGWTLRELLEEFGWSCSFEGDEWALETNGVYFIEG